MISWRDALELSRKRSKRKHVFRGLKHSVPLFLLLLLTIVTASSIYTLLERAHAAAIDSRYPHPSHLRVLADNPQKEKTALTAAQIAALKRHPAVQAAMTTIPFMTNIFADLGETRYAPLKTLCGYQQEFFELYRTLPREKENPDAAPILLGRDLLALSWSHRQERFIRNEQQEMARWLGRSFKIYLNPYGIEQFESRFEAIHTDYSRYRADLLKNRKLKLEELQRVNPDLARRQDALYVTVQVVGFIRDTESGGMVSVLPRETLDQLQELYLLQRDRKQARKGDDEEQTSIALLARPGREQELGRAIAGMGLKLYDRKKDSMAAKLYQALQAEEDLRVTLGIMFVIYGIVMLVIVYQLLSGQVKDAIREIGLLRCIGARRSDIMRLFTVMNLMRLAKLYLLSLGSSFLLLWSAGYWLAGPLNLIKPESLAKGSIPDFLISRVDHFSPFWLMAPWWVWLAPALLLTPIALCAAAIPVWRVMRVQPSEALRD